MNTEIPAEQVTAAQQAAAADPGAVKRMFPWPMGSSCPQTMRPS